MEARVRRSSASTAHPRSKSLFVLLLLAVILSVLVSEVKSARSRYGDDDGDYDEDDYEDADDMYDEPEDYRPPPRPSARSGRPSSSYRDEQEEPE